MRSFLAFAAAAVRQQAGYRAEILSMVLGALIEVFARISIWKAVYGGQHAVAGITLPQMIAYAIIGATLLSSWDAALVVREIGAAIRTGQIANSLVRPASFPLTLFAENLGPRLFNFAVVCTPVIVVFSLIYGLLPPASVAHGLVFIGYLAVSTTLLLLISILFGLLSFWVFDAHSLEWFMRGFGALLSGGLVPLWFFPPVLAEAAHVLPFAWITYYPMAVYLGQLDLVSSLAYLAVGLCWIAVLVGLIAALWSGACRRIVVQGG
ncbi:ABC-2 family transporter protein [Rhizobium sp. MC63]|uniref:ABC-2 family transporter protein n=1 Tax=Rhizobium mulingense TaxID=3031128 RepID=A0ACC6N1M1_9HYPH|nr:MULTISPECIES: ABC-2 family transporter protein [unclassified Rhizobium]MDF0699248.1 ABC-2 family transporter protein [Rhizobium sp. MC63]MEA3519566.1 ABC-2 family transporter protein [Rhizobium sp. MJ31]MEB3046069.1 ABC-2 family transporter protein [Rhizobium sp. MJ21]